MGSYNHASANADAAISIGNANNTASGTVNSSGVLAGTLTTAATIGYRSIAIGNANLTSGNDSIAIGYANTVSANQSIAIGRGSTASGSTSIAFGYNSSSPIANTINIAAVQIAKKDPTGLSGAETFRQLSTGEVVLFSGEINAKVAASVDIGFPSNCTFWVNEVGIILTTLGGTITTKPTVSMGTAADTTKFVSSSLTTLLTAITLREVFAVSASAASQPITSSSSLRSTINTPVAAGSSTISVTFYYKGILKENE